MNRENILSFASGIFDKVHKVNDDVFKAELTFGTGSTAGVYFLDFSQNVKDVNFKEYQRSLLAKEYFKQRGSLQWNYYLLILQDSLEKAKKYEIESDDQFARKYVFNENEFKDFFRIEKTEGSVAQDVTIKWKKDLDAINFSEVYSRVPMTKAVERYVDNQAQNAEIPDFFEGKEQLEIDKIDQLILTNDYREYPKEHRNLSFGKANLFNGINGVGKTSLFESIEMMLCGKTLQNPDILEEEGAIKAFFNGSDEEYSYLPHDSNLYQSRDLFWYSNPKSKGTSLVESFNRFNYFNSDAAYEFAKGDNEDSIRNALYNLVLGPEYIHLKERVGKIWTSHIRTDFNRLNKDMQTKQEELDSAEKELKKLKVDHKVKLVENAISDNCTKLDLVVEIDDLEKKYPSIELKINEVEVLLNSIQNLFGDGVTREDIEQRGINHSSYIERLSAFLEKIRTLNEQKRVEKKQYDALLVKKRTLDQVEKYFRNPELFEVEDLQNKKSKTDRKIQQIEKVTEKSDGVKFDTVSFQDLELENALAKMLDQQQEEKKTVEVISDEIQGILKKYGEIDRINKQILQLGKDFLQLSNDASDCPLCLTHFHPKELKKRINRVAKFDEDKYSEGLNNLNSRLKKSQKNLDELTREISVIKLLQECLSKLDIVESEVNNSSIVDNVQQLKKELSIKPQLEKEKIRLEKLEDKIYAFDASGSELRVIRNEMNTLFPDIEFTESGLNDFTSAKNKTEKQLSELDKTIDSLTKHVVLENERFKREEKLDVEIELDIESLKEEGEWNTQRIEKAKSLYQELGRELKVKKTKSIGEYLRLIKLIEKNIGQYKEELKNRSQVNFWEEQKGKAAEFLSKNEDKLQRLKNANKTLEYIEKEMASNTHLESFFDANLKEIFDIFMTIHVPKEFKYMEFVDGDLNLIDKSDKTRKVTEISTGQRSALALSIFLCLNRKLKNGPNVILFDDPISFIDDFNALSFLDYLRYFVLHEKKQLFFATANIKLASLFKKKFLFLQENFKTWEFQRELVN